MKILNEVITIGSTSISIVGSDINIGKTLWYKPEKYIIAVKHFNSVVTKFIIMLISYLIFT